MLQATVGIEYALQGDHVFGFDVMKGKGHDTP